MKLTAPKLLYGRYFEIHLKHDVQLNDQNNAQIILIMIHTIDYISEHLLDYVRKGFINLKHRYNGLIIKDALNEVITEINSRITLSSLVLHILFQICQEVLERYRFLEDLKKVLHYICRTIRGLLIQFKIPSDDPIILNIRDIDLFNLKMIPKNVIAVVLNESIDFTVLRYLSQRKIIYILTDEKLVHNSWYYMDPVYRMIVKE